MVKVTHEGRLVGRLAKTPDRRIAFEYDPDWLQTGFSLSPLRLPFASGVHFASREPFEGLPGVFNDSLPDGWGRYLLDRYLRTRGEQPDRFGPLDRLTWVGSRGMGALCYEPDASLEPDPIVHDIERMAMAADLVLRDQPADDLEALFRNSGGSSGARPKVMVSDDQGQWIVKFPGPTDPPDIGRVEYETSLMAREAGVRIPETRLFEGRFFGTKRFDRVDGRRIHVITASGLLHADHRAPSMDYVDLGAALWTLSKDIREVEALVRLMRFNARIGNRDDHAKNFSFMWMDGRWSLAPAYDLVPDHGNPYGHMTSFDGSDTPTDADLDRVARKLGVV